LHLTDLLFMGKLSSNNALGLYPIMKTLSTGLLLLVVIAAIAGSYLYFSRPTANDLGLDHAGPQQIADGDVTVKWLGVSTLLIDDGETQLMTDGFISRPALLDLILDRPIQPDTQAIQAQLAYLGVDRLRAVMTVHSHYDHALDTGEIALQTAADVLGSMSTANLARGARVPERQIKAVVPGLQYHYGRFTVTFYESRHAPLVDAGPPNPGVMTTPLPPPQPASHYKEGGSYSIVINHPEGNMLIQGSAGFIPGALSGIKVDAVFLGVGGLGQLGREHTQSYLREMVNITQPEDVYVIHHDDLTAPFGEIRLLPTLVMDKTFFFELKQLALPAQLYAMGFNEAVRVGP
jgi:L-ascorbate metabolism protein UlaG (beta-lactamase superfamily)